MTPKNNKYELINNNYKVLEITLREHSGIRRNVMTAKRTARTSEDQTCNREMPEE